MGSQRNSVDEYDLNGLSEVKEMFSHADPVPSGLTERIKFELTVQAMHAEVAELMDSAMLATRGEIHVEPTRTESVTFSAASVSLMVTANPSDLEDRVRIDGFVTVAGATIETVSTEGSVSNVADANGRFVVDDLPHGPTHFVIRVVPEDDYVRPVITPTIQV